MKCRDVAKVIGVIVIVIGILCAGVVLFNSTYVGQRYDVVVMVQAVERSTRFGGHTNVWVLTCAGEDPLMYSFNGYHDFYLGKTYRIVFINTYAFWGLGVRGNVVSIDRQWEWSL